MIPDADKRTSPRCGSVPESILQTRPPEALLRRAPGPAGCALLYLALFCQNPVAGTDRTPAPDPTLEFQIARGFQIQLVAAEPLVFDPVAVAFDGNGRMFVAEHREFPEDDASPPYAGRIRLLTDTDGDGVMDLSHDFAEEIPAPSALFCWKNGVLVAAGHQILFLQDTNRDGRADLQQVVYGGPSPRRERSFGGLVIRSWAWGWDQRLHAAARALGLSLLLPPVEDPLSAGLDEHDLVFDPQTGLVAVDSGHGSSAVAFDALGVKLVSQPARPLLQQMWRASHVDLAAGYVLPPALYDLIGPLSAQALSSGGRPHPATGAQQRRGRATAAWFSEVSAMTVYRGTLFPAEYQNDIFVADARAGVVRRYKLSGEGPERMAFRPAGDKTEFLTSTNAWFRPVHLTVGPEGALYVVDLHREFVDRAEELPARLQEQARLRRGADRGRIYRVVPEGFRPPAPPRLEEADLVEILRLLAHSNAWHRETAARMICQREDRAAAILLLSNMVVVARSPLARQTAFDVLGGLRALNPALVSRALQDTNPAVRLQAVRWLGVLAEPGARLPESLWPPLRRLAVDPSPWIRYELALLLARYEASQREIALVEIARRSPDSPYTRAAVLLALARNPGDSMTLGLLDPVLTRHPAGRLFLQELARLSGRLEHAPGIQQILAYAQRSEDAELALSLMASLHEGLRERGDTLARHAEHAVFQPAWTRALLAADDRGLPLPVRLEAVRLLSALPYLEAREVLAARLFTPEPAPLQIAALYALAGYEGTEAARLAVQAWPGLAPPVRSAAWKVWLARSESALVLLDAFEQGRLPATLVPPSERDWLRRYPAATVAARAQKWTDVATDPNRVERQQLLLTHPPTGGLASRGRTVFELRCAGCHRFQSAGTALGPDLEAASMRGRTFVLRRILQPNQHLSTRAELRWVETSNREFLLGTVLSENPAGLWLWTVHGETLALPRNQLRSIIPLGRSIMPEGLESGLTPEQLADLLAFLVPEERDPISSGPRSQ